MPKGCVTSLSNSWAVSVAFFAHRRIVQWCRLLAVLGVDVSPHVINSWVVSAIFVAAAQCSGVLSALKLANKTRPMTQERHYAQDLGKSPDFESFLAVRCSFRFSQLGGSVWWCWRLRWVFAIALLSRHLLCAMAP